LVLYFRRPGFQSQFSDAMVAQVSGSDPLGPVVAWIRGNLSAASVDTVARGTGHSVRTLHRRCLRHIGITPANLVDRLRVEKARTLLASSRRSNKELASLCGFSSSTHMNRAFERELGMGPRAYRLLHPSDS
jgi:transcriptional regulator GlxA family with amidase domain